MKSTRKKGFTIIELMIVMLIMGFLLAAAATSLRAAQVSTRDNQRITGLAILSKAIDSYALENKGLYPTCAQVFTPPSAIQKYFTTTNTFPTDPKPPAAVSTCVNFTHGYMYYRWAAGNPADALKVKYVLIAGLEKAPSPDVTTLIVAPANNSIAGWNIGSISSRTAYYLPGPYCGSSC
jgi:prepilin-type N-terminal cleavage/methylation domain-containing protein